MLMRSGSSAAGTLNGFLDPAFVSAVKGLGSLEPDPRRADHRHLPVSHRTRGAIEAGYEVQVVAGRLRELVGVLGRAHLRPAARTGGATITGGNQVLSELFTDFGTEQGQKAQQINMDEIIAKMPAA